MAIDTSIGSTLAKLHTHQHHMSLKTVFFKPPKAYLGSMQFKKRTCLTRTTNQSTQRRTYKRSLRPSANFAESGSVKHPLAISGSICTYVNRIMLTSMFSTTIFQLVISSCMEVLVSAPVCTLMSRGGQFSST